MGGWLRGDGTTQQHNNKNKNKKIQSEPKSKGCYVGWYSVNNAKKAATKKRFRARFCFKGIQYTVCVKRKPGFRAGLV